jgi:hypothetical protein
MTQRSGDLNTEVVSGVARVRGPVRFLDNLTVDGDLTLGDDFSLGDDGVVTGDLTVTASTVLSGAVRLGGEFADLASTAGAQTIPATGFMFNLTGTEAITSIVPTGMTGRLIVLKFASTAALTDGSNLKLAGNLTGSADDVIVLICDGTNWYEVCRSVN